MSRSITSRLIIIEQFPQNFINKVHKIVIVILTQPVQGIDQNVPLFSPFVNCGTPGNNSQWHTTLIPYYSLPTAKYS